MNLDPPHFVWPPVDPEIEQAVLAQLRRSVSIWDGGGIFGEFESAFAELHHRSHACLFSSGTSALHAAYVAMGLGPGDEVICPATTFWATVTPLLWTGATPVLCDCDEEGNLDPALVPGLITERTKAVAVTHMWGVPAKLAALRELCDSAGLLLLEDCSHAHGARLEDGRIVGGVGDLAVWSLQGHKTINGGEGGILLCDNQELYHSSLLFGQPGMRCLWSPYGVTGMGLKQRAHPLAVAIAAKLLERLPAILAGRERIARMWMEALEGCPAVSFPLPKGRIFTWYAMQLIVDGGAEERDEALRRLHEAGVVEANPPGTSGPLNLLPLFQNPAGLFEGTPFTHDFSYRPGMFPIAEDRYARTIVLPVFAGLTEREERLAVIYRDSLVKALS